MISDALKKDYDLLARGRGLVELPDRTLIELSGADKQSFLHNFCTADVKAMQAGDVTEVFVLDPRGKTLGYGHLLLLEDALCLSVASASVGPALIEHLNRYVIRDDVQITDRSREYICLLIAHSNEQTDRIPEFPVNRVAKVSCDEHSMIAADGEFAGPAWLLLVPAPNLPAIRNCLVNSYDLHMADLEALHMIRLESGTPWYGLDLDATNLPQEIQRDRQAISFTKGCYLGQETVARIDSIGHVNRLLVGLQIQSSHVPKPADTVMSDDNPVGHIQSATFSPILNGPLALASIKRDFAENETPLTVNQSPARRVTLPLHREQ